MGLPPTAPNSPYSTGGSYGSYPGVQPDEEAPRAPALWASFAVDQQGRLAWIVDQGSAGEAAGRALAACRQGGGQNCQTIDSFSEVCGAPAYDMQTNVYMGYAASPSDAQRYAVEKCDKANPGGHCQLAGLGICTGAYWSGNGNAVRMSHEAASVTREQLVTLTASYRSSRPFWGAFASGPGDNEIRQALDERSRKEAEDHAMSQCRGSGCRILASFENTCAAIGFPTDSKYGDVYLGPDIDKDPDVVHRSLQAKCDAAYGKQCMVMVRCTGANYPDTAPFLPGPEASTASSAAQAVAEPAPDPAPTRPSYQACLDASDGVTAAMNDCIGTEFDYQDARLNKVYGALRAALDPERKSALRSEELKWIASRDASCAPAKDGGTAAMLDSNACRVDRTAERAAVLERMLGAHAAGGGTDGR